MENENTQKPSYDVKTELTDYRGEKITFGDEYADELLAYIIKTEGCKVADDELDDKIWSSYDERNWNSYNGGFLGNDMLVKWLDDRQYLALHRSGDVRGNYTNFIDITDSDILGALDNVNAMMTIKVTGKEYVTYNQQSYDQFYFDDIDELGLNSEMLEILWNHHI